MTLSVLFFVWQSHCSYKHRLPTLSSTRMCEASVLRTCLRCARRQLSSDNCLRKIPTSCLQGTPGLLCDAWSGVLTNPDRITRKLRRYVQTHIVADWFFISEKYFSASFSFVECLSGGRMHSLQLPCVLLRKSRGGTTILYRHRQNARL